jgi:hypothetical protein
MKQIKSFFTSGEFETLVPYIIMGLLGLATYFVLTSIAEIL